MSSRKPGKKLLLGSTDEQRQISFLINTPRSASLRVHVYVLVSKLVGFDVFRFSVYTTTWVR